MNKLCLAALTLAVALSATAATVTPEQALAAAQEKARSSRMKAPRQSMNLVYTMTDKATAAPTVYVFSPKSGAGYMVVSADDATAPLLGYSDTETFDVDNMAPALRYWLECYSREIAYRSVNGFNSKSATKTPLTLPEEGTVLRSRSSKAAREAISALCATTWDQGAPYYNMTPTYNGTHCVTGCVATAISQVMKKYNYPTTGTGTKSYTYTTQGGTSKTLTLNLGNTTFDWANMLNSYSGSYNTTQANAVANLMYAAGVIAEMNYTTTSSGAVTSTAIGGMITYMGYDKGVTPLIRASVTAEEFSDGIYSELAAGHPVVFSARTSSDEGHCFICDGYSSDDYFHINWGWSGLGDGYYLLSNLDPGLQGIGGSSDNLAFNYGQTAYLGVKPDAGGSYVYLMELGKSMSTDQSSYAVSSSNTVAVSFGMYNASLTTFSPYLGLRFFNGYSKVLSFGSDELAPGYGWGGLNIRATNTNFPVGEYDMEVVWSTDGSNWQTPVASEEGIVTSLHVVSTSSTITFTQNDPGTGSGEDPGETEPSAVATISSITPETSGDTGFYPGHSYNFNWSIAGSDIPAEGWSKDLIMFIFDSNYSIIEMSDAETVAFSADGSVSKTYTLELPYSYGAGTVMIGLGYYDNGYNLIQNVCTITIEYSPTEGYASIKDGVGTIGWSGTTAPTGTASSPAELDSKYAGFYFTLDCAAGPWTQTLDGYVLDTAGNLVSYTPTQTVTLAEGATQRVNFYVGSDPEAYQDQSQAPKARVSEMSTPLVSGVTYLFVPVSTTYGSLSSPVYFKLVDGLIPTGASIPQITAPEAEAAYYTLQGVKVEKPATGLYIEVKGGTPRKVYLR